MSNFISLHQPGGLRNNWLPGESSYQTFYNVADPTGQGRPALSAFRLFVPPGCTMLTLMANVRNLAAMQFTARIGQQPILVQSDSQEMNGFGYNALVSGDCCGTNNGGFLFVIDGPCQELDGKWLYVAISSGSGSEIGITSLVSVNMRMYSDWYNKAVWDSNGDPIQPGSVVPTPVPTPSPQPVPTPTPQPVPIPTPSNTVIDIKIVPGQLYRFVT